MNVWHRLLKTTITYSIGLIDCASNKSKTRGVHIATNNRLT